MSDLSFNLIPVGKYLSEFNLILNISLPCDTIYISSGLEIHISKRHPDCLPYLDKISDIISHPDFIGNNPQEPNSIELIKRYNDNIMIAVKLDTDKNYLFVASLFDISEGKLQRRLNSGRIKAFDIFD